MRISFRLVDVFTEVPFAGNQLCVVSETPPGLTTEQMQTITREINFSETTFVTAVRTDGYDVRIFTPDGELPFAGHPTLGTAFTLVQAGMVPSPVVQTSRRGTCRSTSIRRPGRRACSSCRRRSAPRSGIVPRWRVPRVSTRRT